jgi:ferredoxin
VRVATTDAAPADVTVDKGLCASSSACVFAAPGVFELDENDESQVIADAEPTSAATLREIAYNCPAGAIVVRPL